MVLARFGPMAARFGPPKIPKYLENGPFWDKKKRSKVSQKRSLTQMIADWCGCSGKSIQPTPDVFRPINAAPSPSIVAGPRTWEPPHTHPPLLGLVPQVKGDWTSHAPAVQTRLFVQEQRLPTTKRTEGACVGTRCTKGWCWQTGDVACEGHGGWRVVDQGAQFKGNAHGATHAIAYHVPWNGTLHQTRCSGKQRAPEKKKEQQKTFFSS